MWACQCRNQVCKVHNMSLKIAPFEVSQAIRTCHGEPTKQYSLIWEISQLPAGALLLWTVVDVYRGKRGSHSQK